MGEEAKAEQPVTEAKTEENKEEEQQSPLSKEAKKDEQPSPPEEKKKEEELPQPPAPFIIYVDLHCAGCAKKIQKCIMKIRGVEGVVTEMGKNQVTIKGVVEPQAICNMIMNKTKRKAHLLSPLPPAQPQPMPQLVTSQVSELTTVELNVNMHCEACAQQLRKKILKMRGVQTAETELSSGKVIVAGTMDAEKLVNYVYRRTKKTARIVPQPEPEEPNPADSEKKEEKGDQSPPESGGGDQTTLEESEGGGPNQAPPPIPASDAGEVAMTIHPINYIEEDSMNKMVYYPYNYQSLYFIERIPPPQLFSDENPNACCIS